MKSVALWLIVLVLCVAAGYCAGRRQAPTVTRLQLVAADSALRDAQAHIAGLERSNHQLADQRQVAEAARRTEEAKSKDAASRAAAAEVRADSIRNARARTPALASSASVHDSLRVTRLQLVAADLENTELRKALLERTHEIFAKDSIERIRVRDVALLVTAKDEAVAQLSRTMTALEAAREAVANSSPRCRGPLGLPCPSRLVSAAGGVLTAVAIGLVAR